MCHYNTARQGVRKEWILREDENGFRLYPEGRMQREHHLNRWGRGANRVKQCKLETPDETQTGMVSRILKKDVPQSPVVDTSGTFIVYSTRMTGVCLENNRFIEGRKLL